MPIFDRKIRAKAKAGDAVADMRFEARCPEGHEIYGQRTETFQALRCPECGEGVFVLPTSRLPVPPAASPAELIPLSQIFDKPLVRGVAAEFEEDDAEALALLEKAGVGVSDTRKKDRKPKAAKPPAMAPIPLEDAAKVTGRVPVEMSPNDPAADFPVEQGREIADADFQKLVDEDADRKATEGQETQSRLSRLSRRVKGSRRQAVADQPETGQEPTAEEEEDFEPEIEAAPRVPLYRRIGTRTWVALGLIVVVGLTVRAQIRQAYRDRIPEIVKNARTKGLESLDAGRFDEAKQILAEGAAAFEYLREDSDDARAIVQASREAAILADLVGRPLEEIIDQFAAGESGKADFRNLDKGRSIVIEAVVVATPEQGDGYDLDYRVAVGPGPVPARPLGRLDLKGLELIENLKPRVGENVLMGARLRDLELADGVWWIRLEPKSGVMMTRWKALESLGWPVTERAGDAEKEAQP